MAGPCSILMDFDYTEAKLCKIRQFSCIFALLCSEKILCALRRLHSALGRLHCALARLHCALARTKKEKNPLAVCASSRRGLFLETIFQQIFCRVCIFPQGPFLRNKNVMWKVMGALLQIDSQVSW